MPSYGPPGGPNVACMPHSIGGRYVPRVAHTKTIVPRVPANFVRRKPLRDLLDQAAAAPVTVVCAPAGYGKTLLLADWVETTGHADKAWLSLDDSDNDPGQFWTEVLGALHGCEVVPADSGLRELAPPARFDVAGFLAGLLDALDALPTPLYLVLDDLHEVGQETLRGIETLIRHLPGALRLVLSSRSDPPLPLARLRVEGRLRMLRANELRFSEEDASKLLEGAGVSLTEDQLRRLVAQTDGWAAGLRLAAQSLRNVRDRDAFLADFARDDHAVADYLVGEVLTRMPEDTAEFLRVISVCDEVAPLLAGVLSGRDDAGMVLDALERESSLVIGVGRDRRWYRVHPLLRAYLRGDLDRRRPELAADLHRIAAAWFASEERPRQALDHAVQADEQGTVRHLLRRHALTLLLNGDHQVVRQALSNAGTPGATDESWPALISALAHLEEGELTAAGAELAATGMAPGTDGPDLMSLRRLVLSTYALASGHAPDHEPVDWHEIVSTQQGTGLEAWVHLATGWSRIGTGDREDARQELDAAEQLARGQGSDYLLMHCRIAQAMAAGLDGDHLAMETACADSIAIADRHGWRGSPWLGISHVMLGFVRLGRLDPAGARREAAQAAGTLDRAPDPRHRYLIRLIEGAARFDGGERSAGLRLMQWARGELADIALLPEMAAAVALIECHCATLLGEDALAREVLLWAQERTGTTAESVLMTAWRKFARNDVESAGQAITGVLEGGWPVLAPTTVLEARLLESAVAIRSGQRTRARSALESALRLAEPAALIQPFEHADPAVRQLLVDQIGGFGGADAFAARVRLVLSDVDGGRAAGTLTEREHVVLSRLTTLRSLDEVASDLSVSVNTVKTHVRAIYAKLGVNSRRAAVLAGRERGLT
jgi:LuxR family maltose regulon positive regulatory protein